MVVAPPEPAAKRLPLTLSPHDVKSGRELVDDTLPGLPNLAAVADGLHRGLAALAARNSLRLDIETPPNGQSGLTQITPL